ncbi:MAG: hypothetical protein ACI8QC_003537 [Planctomycetota bacterium]|jgi:hypothetical protein
MQLRSRLNREGIPIESYCIGYDALPKYEGIVLRKALCGWHINHFERGEQYLIESVFSEEKACSRMYELLMEQHRPDYVAAVPAPTLRDRLTRAAPVVLGVVFLTLAIAKVVGVVLMRVLTPEDVSGWFVVKQLVFAVSLLGLALSCKLKVQGAASLGSLLEAADDVLGDDLPDECTRLENIILLLEHDIPTSPNLPLLDAASPRPALDVASKCVALYCLTGMPRGASEESLQEWLVAEGGLDCLEPFELKLLKLGKPEEPLLSDLAWKSESLYALAWAGSLIDELPWPSEECDLSKVLSSIPGPGCLSIAEFKAGFELRPRSQIFEALDLYYSLYASLRHPELWPEGELPTGPIFDVVMERRRALEWLCSTVGWEDVDLDT